MVKPEIPTEVNGNPVEWIFQLNPPRFPMGYPDDGPLEETCALLLSVADKGTEGERFWVSCLGVDGELMAGELYFTLDAAKSFPSQEFDLPTDQWERVE